MDEKEKAFELEEETVQIHDTEAEQKAAREEAQRAEKLEREQRQQMAKLQAQKASVLKKAQSDIVVYKNRILAAEKKQQTYQAEIAVLNKDIKKLQDQVAHLEAKAQFQESAVRDDKKMIDKARQDKADLLRRKDKALHDTDQANQDIRRMKIDFARMQMETRELEGHLRLVEQAAAKRQAERDRLQRDIAAMKQRKEAADQAIRERNGSH